MNLLFESTNGILVVENMTLVVKWPVCTRLASDLLRVLQLILAGIWCTEVYSPLYRARLLRVEMHRIIRFMSVALCNALC